MEKACGRHPPIPDYDNHREWLSLILYAAMPHMKRQCLQIFATGLAYTKNAQSDLTPADKKAWAKLVVAIKKEARGK